VSTAIGAPARKTTAVTVPATANIFGSGDSPLPAPAPAGGGGGTDPVAYALPPDAGLITFSGGSGSVTCCGGFSTPPYNGPAGAMPLPPGTTDIPAVGGISGVYVSDRQMFLAGVFLTGETAGVSPPRTNTLTQVPALQQVFYVGAGPRTVGVPEGATQLFLGFADAFGFRGRAGYYDDNRGSVRINVTLKKSAHPPPVPIETVSNGCGGAGWRVLENAQNYLGNTSTYWNSRDGLLFDPEAKSYTVAFTEACNLHDAGYAGAVVRDKLRGGIKDFRGWSRKQVDEKFLADMRLLCERSIPKTAVHALRNCRGRGGNVSFGAESRYKFVRSQGYRFFDADLTEPGTQRRGSRANV
jgi:hypothetical protein